MSPDCDADSPTAPTTAPGAAAAPWKPSHNPWLIATAVMAATFMEILDTSVANVALPHIAGNLSATHRGGHLGADQLPGIQRHRAAHDRLAGDALSAGNGC